MKRVLIAYGALVLVVIVLAFARFNGFGFLPNFSGASVQIKEQTYNVTLAKDDKSRQIGLSNKKSLGEKNGMLFIFEKKGKYSFWMKDTEIPLDIIYINDNKIVHIVKNAPPHKDKPGQAPIYSPPADANYVLEINGGLSDKNNFQNGDTVVFKGVN